MKKQPRTYLIAGILTIACFTLEDAKADIVFWQSGIHTLNWKVWDEEVYVRETAVLNVISGADLTRNLLGYETSQINIYDGRIAMELVGRDFSQINIYGGEIDQAVSAMSYSHVSLVDGFVAQLSTQNYSTAAISGGYIRGGIWAEDNTHITISGGSFDGTLRAGWEGLSSNSVITIIGTNFNYGYGQILDSSGTLTGVLANGDQIDNSFQIYDGSTIILIPEPATLLLLGLGGVTLRKHRK